MVIVYNSKNHQHTILLIVNTTGKIIYINKGDIIVPCETPESTETE